MLSIKPSGQNLGATIDGLDLSKTVGDQDLGEIVQALGRHGYVRFSNQKLNHFELKALSEQFGELQVSVQPPTGVKIECPGVGVLSNIVIDGKPIGKADAGLMWHTEASYNNVVGYVNVLHAIKVPVRDGQVLGGTELVDTRGAYDGLPKDIKDQLKGAIAVHDVQNYWDSASEGGSTRPPFSEEQRKKKPIVDHPIFLPHPITGKNALYVNPGFTVRIKDLSERDSEEMLAFLFEHLMKPEYRHLYTWAEGDVMIWDNLLTMHRAVLDYRPDEPRWMIRCQVMGSKIFDPAFAHAVGLADGTAG
jgi:taurine dioxygenase